MYGTAHTHSSGEREAITTVGRTISLCPASVPTIMAPVPEGWQYSMALLNNYQGTLYKDTQDNKKT